MDNSMILVVDSDLTVAACMAEALATQGYTVHCHSGPRLTADAVARLRPDLLIIDEWKINTDMIPLLERLRQCDQTRAVGVIVSSTDWRVLAEQATLLETLGCATLLKPFELDLLFARVGNVLGHGCPVPARQAERLYA
ncbi:MAG: hypothetical protein OHK0022_30630 [Roseiflexaceae bacterium]